ncbi:MAG: hypothetical protein NTZ26_07250 [Candidatus Aminicenantes bacterium]|nr:hypothetical protein [Candidatus Aminicenantes bacterium]
MSIARRFLIPLLLLAALAPARGQYANSYGYTFNNPVSASCNQMFWDKMNARQTYKALLKKKGYSDAQLERLSTETMEALLAGKEGKAAETPAMAAPAATRFKPARSRLLLPALAGSLGTTAEQKKALTEVFEAGLEGYEKEAASSGLINDVAGAIAYFIGVGYYVIHDGDEPDGDGLEAIGRTLQHTLDTPPFRSIADPDKQKFYELMIGLGTYFAVAYRQAAEGGDAKAAAVIKDAASESLKGFLNLEPSTIRITREGMEIVR